jgi:hypothetical protein
MATSSHTI